MTILKRKRLYSLVKRVYKPEGGVRRAHDPVDRRRGRRGRGHGARGGAQRLPRGQREVRVHREGVLHGAVYDPVALFTHFQVTSGHFGVPSGTRATVEALI